MKMINLSKSVFQICTEYPEVVFILEKAGFSEITKPGMLQSAGRFMTIPKGAAMKRIDLEEIKKLFLQNGYEFK